MITTKLQTGTSCWSSFLSEKQRQTRKRQTHTHRFKDRISMIQQKWNDWDKLEQRWSKTQKRQLEEGFQAAKWRRSARTEWEPTACRRSSSRRERGAACLGWDSKTWCVLGSRMRGPAGTGHGGVLMVGGLEGEGARKGNGVRGHRLPSPPCFCLCISAFCLDKACW